MAAPEPEPTAPPDEPEPERARRLRRLSRLVQAGGLAFLAVASLGLLPSIISSYWPALGAKAAVAVWLVAPVIPIALLAVAALRLRR